MYDVVIAYRIYPGISKQPFISFDNKLHLVELGLVSFRKSLEGLSYKIYFILDNCPGSYEQLLLSHFDLADIEILQAGEKGGNGGTFNMQLDLLLSQEESEYIYFAEDDYLYKKDEFKKMLFFLQKNSNVVDFVSPHDHTDYYQALIHKSYPYQLMTGEGKHWHSASTTCLTFLTTKSVISKTAPIFRTYNKGNFDVSIWMILTKSYLLNPVLLFKILKNRSSLVFVLKAYYYGIFYLLSAKRRMLWIPITAVGTHMQFDELSPNSDWMNIVNEIEQQIDKDKSLMHGSK
jgi:hypothetical protein